MANTFIALPAPAANGAGAWTDVSTMGALKTVTVTGNGGVFEPFVTIECSNQSAPTANDAGFALKTFTTPGEESFGVACHWMRAVVSNYKGGGAPTVELGGTTDGTSFAQLVSPSGDGDGAGVDVSSLPPFKTVQVVGDFRGTLNIMVSEDGGTTYQTAFSFTGGQQGGQSATVAADFMKVQRSGTPLVSPGTPEVWIGATTGDGGGGGGGLGVNVENQGVAIASNPHTTLNFTGSGVVASDAGGGVADITIVGPQTFRYTADGSETTAGFTITIPTPRSNVNYNAIVTMGDCANDIALQAPPSGYAVGQFTCVPGANLTAGDILLITIIDLS